MELINYLAENFYTKEKLLELCMVSSSQFERWQAENLAPKASYRLGLDVTCQSFFGDHQEVVQQEYFAKGYVSWLTFVQLNPSQSACFTEFRQRYLNTLHRLNEQGHSTNKAELNEAIKQHIESEWQHFLNGIYGLCTRTGLPEDIAAKELAIAEINELIDNQVSSDAELDKLAKAVDLLDNASAQFAPHERARSSRFKLIDEVRRQYRLHTNATVS